MIKVSAYPNMNAALDACGSTFGDRGGELHLDKPTTLVETQRYQHHNLSVRGEGNASQVTPTYADGDCIWFGRSDGSEIRNIMLRDFHIEPASDRSGGWAVRMDRGVRTTVDNVDLSGPEVPGRHFGGLWFNGYDDCLVENSNVVARHKGILINGEKNQSYGADIVIGSGVKIQNHRQPSMSDHLAGSVGIHLAGGQGGTYLDACHVIYCGNGILIDPSMAGVQNREVFLNPGTIVDSCVEDGIRVLAKAMGTLQMNGVWSASNGRGGSGNGLRVQPDQVGGATIHITGGRFFNHEAGDGIAINGGYAAITGVVLNSNRDYGLHVPNGDVRGGADALFGFANGKGLARNISRHFKIGRTF